MKSAPRYVRAVKRLLYRALHARRQPHLATARCAGLKIQFPTNTNVGEAFYADAYGRIERAVLDRLVRPGTIAVDAGANIGFYTCLLAGKTGPSGRVIAVEPTPSCFQMLMHNVALNRQQAIVDCRCCA